MFIDASNSSRIEYQKASLVRVEDLYTYNPSRLVNSRTIGVNIGVWLNKSERNRIIIPVLRLSIEFSDIRNVLGSNSKDPVVMKVTRWII